MASQQLIAIQISGFLEITCMNAETVSEKKEIVLYT
jgi:hypothetical protein